MTDYGGYMGKIGVLDLSTHRFGEYPWTDADRKKFVGGKAAATKIMYDSFSGEEDPLGEENILIVSTGPVTGLGAPSSNRFDISALSPLTGISASSNCGGNFGYYLKRAGYDALVIKGRCDRPTRIEICNDEVTFVDARELWGTRLSEAQSRIKAELDKKYGRSVRCGMIAIGPAGENLVKYASVFSGERAAGRTGMGAVMGSKNIKAISVMGDREAKAYDPQKLKKHHKAWVKMLKENPNTGDLVPKQGTASMLKPMQMNGQLATKNFSRGTFDGWEKISGDTFAETENITNDGCLSCTIRCSRRVRVNGENVKGPELETLGLMGAGLMNDNLSLICRWNKELDELGLDTISTAQTTAWAMTANERGVWKNGLCFGDTEKLSELWEDIAYRRGIGAELAEGTRRLSEKYGGSEFAMQSKGLELAAYEPRRAVGHGLGYATANRGGCHINGGYVIGMEGLILHVDPLTPRGKADLCVLMQNAMEAISLSGQCIFTSFAMFPPYILKHPDGIVARCIEKTVPNIGWALRLINRMPEIVCFNISLIPHSKELQYATGMRMTLGRFIRNGERSFNLERALNAKFGISAKDDTLPKELTELPQDKNDPRTAVPLERMKKTYYKVRGWQKNGLPGENKLRKLGIAE